MKKLLVLSALAAMLASGTALADTSGKKIAFSNNYAGNSWRQAMLDSYGIVTKKAVEDKVVAPPTSSPRPTRKCRPRQPRCRT